MSQDYSGEDPTVRAKRAERDLNSHEAKTGHEQSSSATESGVDASAKHKFAGSKVMYDSAASGAGDNREIPSEEGGAQQRGTGRMTKAGDFDQREAGEGPEDVARRREQDNSGSDDVRANVGK